MTIKVASSDALVIVDLQNDFCPGGALAVPDGDKIVPIVNRLIRKFGYAIATKDWHPKNHSSFRDYGGNWPSHCVQGTDGANFHSELEIYRINRIFYKGMDENKDEYSGMRATHGITTVRGRLWLIGIKRLFVGGLATDYCVKATVLDGLKLGFEVYVVTDAIAAVNVNQDDGEKAIEEMRAAGAKTCKSTSIRK